MPDATYWKKEIRACIRSSFPEFDSGYELHDPTPDHPDTARAVLTGDDAPRLLHRPLERHSFVVYRSRAHDPSVLVFIDRDPFPWPYHPNHDGLIDDAEPHRRHGAVTHAPPRGER